MTDTPARVPMVHLDQVHLTLKSGAGEVNILRGLELVVNTGETVGVVGPSGAGKTSMLMIVAGLERATSGAVTVAGRSLAQMSEDRLAEFRRDNIGIVFQSFHLVPTMSALENVAIPLELAGRRDAFERAAAGLEAVGLGHRLAHFPGQLSGGEQQRVALARAFAPRPRLLLADEPTGNLDLDTGHRVIELMFGLAADHGATLLLITHDREIAQRCDRVVHLVDGRVDRSDAGRGAIRAVGS